jgi:molecular chaperone GrpE (heat shock protein)
MEDIEERKMEPEEQTRQAEERPNQLKYPEADSDIFRTGYTKEKDVITSLASERPIQDLLAIPDAPGRMLPAPERKDRT